MVRHVLQLRNVVALVPFYEDGKGLCSQIHTSDGQVLVDTRGPLLILRRLLRQDGLDFTQFRKAQAKDSHARQRLPIVWRGFAFMTCKMQHARVRGDEAYGYIRIDAVAGIKEEEQLGVIVLKNGERLPSVQKAAAVERYLASGVLASYRAQEMEFRPEGQALAHLLNGVVRRSAPESATAAAIGGVTGAAIGADSMGVNQGGTEQSAFTLAVWMLETALQELRKRDEEHGVIADNAGRGSHTSL
ncbi:MAG: hypothetical protein ACYCYO_10215 [Bacilli bacterium]